MKKVISLFLIVISSLLFAAGPSPLPVTVRTIDGATKVQGTYEIQVTNGSLTQVSPGKARISTAGTSPMTYPSGTGVATVSGGAAWGTTTALGAAYTIFRVDSTGLATEFTDELAIDELDLTSSTSSIPWTVGTTTWPTAEGSAKWDSTNNLLYIGDGAAAKKFVPEGTATGGLIFGDSTPDSAGEFAYDGALKYYDAVGVKTVAVTLSPSFTTPNIGAATGTSLAVTGLLDGLLNVEAVNGKTIDKLSGLYVATGTSNFIVPTPAATGGNQYCFKQANAGTSAITVIPVHTSSVQLGKTDNSAYCTADDKLVSGGAATDQICMIALDATHYLTTSSTGVWTCTAH
jgi:hypothetical protein